MCGIYGIVERSGEADGRFARRQSDLLRHRGPDDDGIWTCKKRTTVLAHRRLSILDLTRAGRQPMQSQNGRYTIVYNGEIYNYREIRAELQTFGYSFRTETDTEVLLTAYEHWRENCVNHLNGMFAFAIYDEGNSSDPESLFLARDRAGEKPLYYSLDGIGFEFASELKAISKKSDLCLDAINFYLALGYVPGDRCIAAGVKKLPPGCFLRVRLPDFSLELKRYWQPPCNSPEPNTSPEELAERAGRIVEDATRLRLHADVPVGVLLSGGLDSSIIVAAAARTSSKSVKTFNIALPGSGLDESSHAAAVARHFGTEHHTLDLGTAGIDAVADIAPFVDEPIADSSLLPTFLVSKLTREHVTVALGGDGGDELFGGYDDYNNSLRDHRILGLVPPSLIRMIGNTAAFLPAGVRGRNRCTSLRAGPLQQMIWGRPYFDVNLRRRILARDAQAALGPELDAPERFLLDLYRKGSDAVDSMTRTHFGSILPDDFLVKVDRMSMAFSLEMRCPLLDYRLIEFAFSSVPSNWKADGKHSRKLQRLLASSWLPGNLIKRNKQGFSIPLDAWLRKCSADHFNNIDHHLPDCINKKEVGNLWSGLEKGRTNGARVFCLLMLSIAAANLRIRRN